MVNYLKGDIFLSKAEAIVNPVNCVGVMGAGLALEFKKRYPDNFRIYQKYCRGGFLKPGTYMLYHEYPHLPDPGRRIVNLATKGHYRNPSSLEIIRNCLASLYHFIETTHCKHLAMPAIGCGHGGLDWSQVQWLIGCQFDSDAVTRLPAQIDVYEPLNK